MDEVDKIIIHSLRQIGCNIDDEIFSLTSFTPELLVYAVAACLQEIKPNTLAIPKRLPEGMAQRFSVATTLAEICAASGYRSDIGYQTFLYPNVVDVRRLLMFLIENLPKESSEGQNDDTDMGDRKEPDLAILERKIRKTMLQSLRAPWVPPFGRENDKNAREHIITQCLEFKPQLNLHIPSGASESLQVQYLAPNIFQQIAIGDFDLISSVIHRNDMELQSPMQYADGYSFARYTANGAISSSISETKEKENIANDKNKITNSKTPMQCISEQVNALKTENDQLIATRKLYNTKINELKSLQTTAQSHIMELRKINKMRERSCVVLEQPEKNVDKLEALIEGALEKRHQLEHQWQTIRSPLEQRMQLLKAKNGNIHKTPLAMNFRELIIQLEQAMLEKVATHTKLNAELKQANQAATRKEYTRRIHEFIGNIRKQRSDIYKVLDDTRDLQKQINTVTAQLQRQFNYTDDLLFKSAKHDAHSRKAYKLLAALHAACNELVELVSQMGNIAKEIRDLEVQIDRENIKNIAVNLEKISFDIKNFENVVKNIQSKIREVENRITEG